MDIHDKIKSIIQELDLNNSSFAKRVGVTSTTIDSITAGRLQDDGSRKKTKPGYDLILSIMEECGVNPDYFFGGDTVMFLKDKKKRRPQKSSLGLPKVISMDPTGEENIVYVPAKARAGYLSGYDDVDYVETLPAFKMPVLTNSTFRCFEVKGNSMSITLSDGDLVFGKYVEGFDEIKDGHVHVIVSANDGIVVKRIINRSQENKTLLLRSDNKDGNYPDYSIPIEEVMEIWYVSMYASKKMPQPTDMFERLLQVESKLRELESKTEEEALE